MTMSSIVLPLIRMSKHSIALNRYVRPSYPHTSISIQPNYYYHHQNCNSSTKVSHKSNKIKKKNNKIFSLSSSSDNKKNPPTDEEKSEADDNRNKTILMNPKGYSHLLQPKNQIYRLNKRDGEQHLVQVDRVYGYFWMLKDLRENDGKPILGHKELIEESDAELFPSLQGLETLDGHKFDLPDVFIRDHRPTLITFSFKDFGYQLLSSWTDPIRNKFMLPANKKYNKKPPVQIVNVCITEGSSIFSFLLKKFVFYSMKRNTSKELYNSTYTYFGDTSDFRDCLRMHNTFTCYVILVDKFGRVRWMGSGKAEEEESGNLINGIEKLIGKI